MKIVERKYDIIEYEIEDIDYNNVLNKMREYFKQGSVMGDIMKTADRKGFIGVVRKTELVNEEVEDNW